jgi:hypothetical protein
LIPSSVLIAIVERVAIVFALQQVNL